MMDLIPNASVESWALLATSLVLFYLYGTSSYGLFKKQGIPGPKPLPFIGTSLHCRKGNLKFYLECYKKYGKIWGLYEGRQPVLVISDPDMIKTVLTKECYSIFDDRPITAPSLLQNCIRGSKDEEWRRTRKLQSANFASGRMKDMFPIIQQNGDTLVKNLRREAEKGQAVIMKHLMGAYSMDVMLNTLFGVNVDSFNNPQDPFVQNGRKISGFVSLNPLLLSVVYFPFLKRIYDMLNISIFPNDAITFFQNFIRRTKQERLEANEKHRVDFLQLMMNSQSHNDMESHKALSDVDIETHLMMSIFAGNVITNTVLSLIMYALATHSDIQKKVQMEIDAALPNKAPTTYDAVVQMEYLDAVVSETLRLYTVNGRIQRICNKDVEINGVFIPKNTVLTVPVLALHQDPKYWSDPEEFHPERFSKKNKERINPYVYLPFGNGPMNCIGKRFALMNIKLAVIKVLQNFSLQVCKETQVPLKFCKNLPPRPEKPILLKVVPRDGTINGA